MLVVLELWLLDLDDSGDPIQEIAARHSVSAYQAWHWLHGDRPLTGRTIAAVERQLGREPGAWVAAARRLSGRPGIPGRTGGVMRVDIEQTDEHVGVSVDGRCRFVAYVGEIEVWQVLLHDDLPGGLIWRRIGETDMRLMTEAMFEQGQEG